MWRLSYKHFARIQDAVWVKDLLDAFHDFDRGPVEGVIEVLGLDVADAVFAGDGAAESD